jgi:inosine-uridine nucleoside N-ribohydrolase
MVKLHIDTDLGGDMDDLCALALALQWHAARVQIVGVTTNTEDGGRRAGYTRFALDLAGHPDVPVAAGADVADGYYRGPNPPGLPADELAYWPQPVPPLPGPLDAALDLLEHSIRDGALILAIGAFTNLALLEKRTPGILRQANLVMMGGYVYPPRTGYPAWTYDFDWNVQVDVASALIVLQQANPLLVTLAHTAETALRRAHLPRLQQGNPLAQLIARQAAAFARDEKIDQLYTTCSEVPRDIINFQHDPLACAIALGWHEEVEIHEVRLRNEIVDGWLRQTIDEQGKPTRVVTRVDGAAFSEFWVQRVSGV